MTRVTGCWSTATCAPAEGCIGVGAPMLTPGIGPATTGLKGLLLFSIPHAAKPSAAVSAAILKRVLHIRVTRNAVQARGARVRNAVYRLEVVQSVVFGDSLGRIRKAAGILPYLASIRTWHPRSRVSDEFG